MVSNHEQKTACQSQILELQIQEEGGTEDTERKSSRFVIEHLQIITEVWLRGNLFSTVQSTAKNVIGTLDVLCNCFVF